MFFVLLEGSVWDKSGFLCNAMGVTTGCSFPGVHSFQGRIWSLSTCVQVMLATMKQSLLMTCCSSMLRPEGQLEQALPLGCLISSNCTTHHALLSCSPDGRTAVIGDHARLGNIGPVFLVDTRRMTPFWSSNDIHWQHDPHDGGTWTVDGALMTLNMPGYGYHLCIHKQGESFTVTKLCDPSLHMGKDQSSQGRNEGYFSQSPAPLPPSWTQMSACFSFKWGRQGLLLPENARIDLVAIATGQVLGSWTMAV